MDQRGQNSRFKRPHGAVAPAKQPFESLPIPRTLLPHMTAQETRQAILDVAETLFAEVGFSATTLRMLTARAGVNLAAVHYHFGSKEELTLAVMDRIVEPVHRARLERLEARAASTGAPGLEDVVRAYVEPVFQAHAIDSAAARTFGRVLGEQPPFLRDFLAARFGPVLSRFARQLQRALPEVEESVCFWRLHFCAGAMAHAMQHAELVRQLSGGRCDPSDTTEIREQLVTFVMAGMQATSPRVGATR